MLKVGGSLYALQKKWKENQQHLMCRAWVEFLAWSAPPKSNHAWLCSRNFSLQSTAGPKPTSFRTFRCPALTLNLSDRRCCLWDTAKAEMVSLRVSAWEIQQWSQYFRSAPLPSSICRAVDSAIWQDNLQVLGTSLETSWWYLIQGLSRQEN